MECSNCHYENEEDSKYCINCGLELSLKKRSKQKVEDVLFVPKKTNKHTTRNVVLIIVICLFFGFILIAWVGSDTEESTNSGGSSSTNTSLNGSTGNSSVNWQPFVSVEHSFSINFPQYPTTERIPENSSSGITYSGTQYSAEDSDQDVYFAEAADYDVPPYGYDTKAGLEGMVNGMLGENTELTGSSFTQFRGYEATNFSLIADGFY
jgi:hypothetical protein